MIEQLTANVTLHCGDCLDVLPTLADNSVDACVTDPPYHLQSIHERFAARGQDETSERYAAGPYGRHATGFMGQKWDGGDIAFRPDVWREVYRVLKPGAHLLACGGTRTYHRLACAIEDAGFEVRDCVQWLHASGFPKSHDVSKGIDRAAGVMGKYGAPKTPAHAGMLAKGVARRGEKHEGWDRPWMDDPEAVKRAQCSYEPATPAAREWSGWGTALKPACEIICLARKPLSEGTIAANVLRHGVGALNIDGCRVAAVGFAASRSRGTATQSNSIGKESRNGTNTYDPFALKGRWPANILQDGSEEVLAGFPETAASSDRPRNNGAFDSVAKGHDCPHVSNGHADSGSAARFFYTSKADSDDRLGSKHPTVKPLDLIQYLVRLVTPRGGLVLDPFAGTGTTGEAAWREGMRAILIEREAEYQDDIRRRMRLAMCGPDERACESAKARNAGKPRDDGPLFGGRNSWDEMWAKPFDKPELL